MQQKLIYRSFGKPLEVLELESAPIPEPQENEALIKLEYANINPSDMGMIGGSYGKLAELPATAGREGVGTILSIKGDTNGLSAGDRVRYPESAGTWQSHCTAPTADLFKIPSSIDPEQAAALFINPPTALMLLKSFVDLKEGDWIIQNAGNSSVGTWVIQLAAAMGYKTINLVRRESLFGPLEELGADVVLVDEDDYPKKLKELTGGASPKLALNSIGGNSVSRMIKCLGESGVCVTFGGMVGDPVRFPTRFLIFNDVQLRGFWMDKWTRTHSKEDLANLYQELFEWIEKHNIHTPIQEVFELKDFSKAIKAFSKPRMGKILFKS
ncbi:MAG: 2-enoyl thioester reductase domain-containing protein [Opitutales bacterium]|nr:2-enoyl thioester reductase domain-containing protein [Opitutales bacterium]